ncbi:PAS domain-containing protein [Candidatus Binatia bacterium]|jgi:PAS domain S-box-containing protein|nr:PAS domain-containing protein [Candidatus Binatia bacterium]
MSKVEVMPSGREISFHEDEIIVSKTDLKGHITYANDVFLRVAGYTESEILGKPHNVIRHPAMPRCVFKLLWDTIRDGREIFAYVINLAKSGDAYWVFAHVTPSRDARGACVGYHSNRRVPHADALDKVRPLYARLAAEEQRAPDPRAAIEASSRLLADTLARAGMDYDRFVFSLSTGTSLAGAA